MQVFGINNIFTDDDADATWRKTFKNATITKMNTAAPDGDWTKLRKAALEYVDEYLSTKGSDAKLAELVQFVTLKVSLRYLFKDAKAAMKRDGSFNNIVYIAKRINELWLESKKDNIEPHWEDEEKLHQALIEVTRRDAPVPGSFPDESDEDDIIDPTSRETNEEVDPRTPRQNPMNFLLPAYETMWRVVLRCILEVHYRGSEDGPKWQKVLLTYFDALQKKDAIKDGAWDQAVKYDDLVPMDIVKETMRLYPPTRSVFDPKRWSSIVSQETRKKAIEGDKTAKCSLKTEEEKLGYMPFALFCTADQKGTNAFGMKMIVLSSAAVISRLDNEWKLQDPTKVPPPGTALQSERDTYEDLVLIPVNK